LLRSFQTVNVAHPRPLAWLGGVERFIGTGGRIGFHVGYDAASDRDSGIGNTAVDAYLAKMGLPYEAAIYITQAAPNDMTWLNMSDAAQRGIRVTLLSSLAKETVVAIPTRYGDVTVTRDGCCVINIRYGDQSAEIAWTDQWPAPGSEDTELGVLMELEVGHGATEVYLRVQA